MNSFEFKRFMFHSHDNPWRQFNPPFRNTLLKPKMDFIKLDIVGDSFALANSNIQYIPINIDSTSDVEWMQAEFQATTGTYGWTFEDPQFCYPWWQLDATSTDVFLPDEYEDYNMDITTDTSNQITTDLPPGITCGGYFNVDVPDVVPGEKRGMWSDWISFTYRNYYMLRYWIKVIDGEVLVRMYGVDDSVGWDELGDMFNTVIAPESPSPDWVYYEEYFFQDIIPYNEDYYPVLEITNNGVDAEWKITDVQVFVINKGISLFGYDTDNNELVEGRILNVQIVSDTQALLVVDMPSTVTIDQLFALQSYGDVHFNFGGSMSNGGSNFVKDYTHDYKFSIQNEIGVIGSSLRNADISSWAAYMHTDGGMGRAVIDLRDNALQETERYFDRQQFTIEFIVSFDRNEDKPAESGGGSVFNHLVSRDIYAGVPKPWRFQVRKDYVSEDYVRTAIMATISFYDPIADTGREINQWLPAYQEPYSASSRDIGIYLAMIWDGQDAKFYMNGQKVAEYNAYEVLLAGGHNIPNPQIFYRYDDYAQAPVQRLMIENLHGWMSELRFTPWPLNEEEIRYVAMKANGAHNKNYYHTVQRRHMYPKMTFTGDSCLFDLPMGEVNKQMEREYSGTITAVDRITNLSNKNYQSGIDSLLELDDIPRFEWEDFDQYDPQKTNMFNTVYGTIARNFAASPYGSYGDSLLSLHHTGEYKLTKDPALSDFSLNVVVKVLGNIIPNEAGALAAPDPTFGYLVSNSVFIAGEGSWSFGIADVPGDDNAVDLKFRYSSTELGDSIVYSLELGRIYNVKTASHSKDVDFPLLDITLNYKSDTRTIEVYVNGKLFFRESNENFIFYWGTGPFYFSPEIDYWRWPGLTLFSGGPTVEYTSKANVALHHFSFHMFGIDDRVVEIVDDYASTPDDQIMRNRDHNYYLPMLNNNYPPSMAQFVPLVNKFANLIALYPNMSYYFGYKARMNEETDAAKHRFGQSPIGPCVEWLPTQYGEISPGNYYYDIESGDNWDRSDNLEMCKRDSDSVGGDLSCGTSDNRSMFSFAEKPYTYDVYRAIDGNVTIEMIVNINTIADNWEKGARLVEVADSEDPLNSCWGIMASRGAIAFYRRMADRYKVFLGATKSFESNLWHHIMFAFSSRAPNWDARFCKGVPSMYVNGKWIIPEQEWWSTVMAVVLPATITSIGYDIVWWWPGGESKNFELPSNWANTTMSFGGHYGYNDPISDPANNNRCFMGGLAYLNIENQFTNESQAYSRYDVFRPYLEKFNNIKPTVEQMDGLGVGL